MKTRTKCIIGIVALLPLTLMADGVLTNQVLKSTSNAEEIERFQPVDRLPIHPAGVAIVYTVPLPY